MEMYACNSERFKSTNFGRHFGPPNKLGTGGLGVYYATEMSSNVILSERGADGVPGARYGGKSGKGDFSGTFRVV